MQQLEASKKSQTLDYHTDKETQHFSFAYVIASPIKTWAQTQITELVI